VIHVQENQHGRTKKESLTRVKKEVAAMMVLEKATLMKS